ncbi:MAG TPA: monovalent cation/H(+) antiporter subunit G [Actinomycetota bacterium]|nr:monovalent cation/H(+) antiporter subunit G [Actinomycetota bacterium]
MTVVGDVMIGLGGLLMVLAGLGILRLPDVFSRMHAGTKAASLGLALILGGSALHMQQLPAVVKLLAALVFQFVTSPVAAHVIGRGAYVSGIPLWEGTLVDELAGLDPEDPSSPEPSD